MNGLRHEYQLEVLVYIWNKNRSATGNVELLWILYRTDTLD